MSVSEPAPVPVERAVNAGTPVRIPEVRDSRLRFIVGLVVGAALMVLDAVGLVYALLVLG